MIKINKKGELTTHQLVGLIILIVSFAVILFLLFRLNLGETTNKEICHNSVIMKGKDIASKFVSGPLDCKTSYLCITGGGECEGINPSETKKIDLNKENSEEELIKVITDEIADCWWMFGEGKINYIGDWIDKPENLETHRCAICSIIKFDESIQESSIKLKVNDIEISLGDKYSIITGMEDKKEYIQPLIVKTSETSTKTTCKEFITKA